MESFAELKNEKLFFFHLSIMILQNLLWFSKRNFSLKSSCDFHHFSFFITSILVSQIFNWGQIYLLIILLMSISNSHTFCSFAKSNIYSKPTNLNPNIDFLGAKIIRTYLLLNWKSKAFLALWLRFFLYFMFHYYDILSRVPIGPTCNSSLSVQTYK